MEQKKVQPSRGRRPNSIGASTDPHRHIDLALTLFGPSNLLNPDSCAQCAIAVKLKRWAFEEARGSGARRTKELLASLSVLAEGHSDCSLKIISESSKLLQCV